MLSSQSSKTIVLFGGSCIEIINFRLPLIQQLSKYNHKVFVLSHDYDKQRKMEVRKAGAIPLSYLGGRFLSNPIRETVNLIYLLRTLKSLECDILFTFFTKQVILGGILSRLLRVKLCIGMIEGLGYAFSQEKLPPKQRIFRCFMRSCVVIGYNMALNAYSKVFLLNKEDQQELSSKYIFSKSIFEVLGPIGVDLNYFRHVPVRKKSNDTRFIFIGRLTKQKGVYDFISAARIIKKRYPSTTFSVLGRFDKDHPSSISADALESAIKDNIIIYYGHVSDVRVELSKADVFVLPSYYREGFPRSTQEAMAIGRPVIVANSIGCREGVIDGYNGFITPPMDPLSLADKMALFIANKTEISLMGNNARNYAKENFNIDKINSKIIESFRL